MFRSVGETAGMDASVTTGVAYAAILSAPEKKMIDGMGIFGNPLTRTITCLFWYLYRSNFFFEKQEKSSHYCTVLTSTSTSTGGGTLVFHGGYCLVIDININRTQGITLLIAILLRFLTPRLDPYGQSGRGPNTVL